MMVMLDCNLVMLDCKGLMEIVLDCWENMPVMGCILPRKDYN